MNVKEVFENRLQEAGVKYSLTELDGRVKTEVPYDSRENDEQWNKDVLAVQGLIYHFLNRKWIINDNYMFIQQNVHWFNFNYDESTYE